MSRIAVRAAGVVSVDGIGDPATVLVDDGVITEILPGHRVVHDRPTIGDGSHLVAPGLIDIHTHGGRGVQAIDGEPEALAVLARFYAEHGVTGFLATIGGAGATIERALAGLSRFVRFPHPSTGARCLGVHLEGPFLSRCCPGAFRPDSIVAPDVATFEHYAALAGGALALITLAPEVDGQSDVVRAARAKDIVCSAGHSAATEEEMLAAIDLGVTSLTHMFNAMTPLHHRSPGIVGVGLTDARLTTELIADGVHVHPTVVRLLALAKGWRGIALVTDSIGAAGLPDGTYHFEEQEVVVADAQARLVDGTLAGSTLTLDVAVANLARFSDLAWHEAVGSASLVPARLLGLGLGARKGVVALGRDADLVGFDADRRVCWTMVEGEVVFERDAA